LLRPFPVFSASLLHTGLTAAATNQNEKVINIEEGEAVLKATNGWHKERLSEVFLPHAKFA
jgi:hypothetical protein